MPRISVDGKDIECKDRQTILQAMLDHGLAMPHYCYHPGLSVPASCRICLVEVEGVPKLVPSCQTQIREGMIVFTQTSKVINNQKQVMEYLLVNHPLDCPVCDQAGECALQDYSYQYGRAQSRFEEDKTKKPKKDVGQHVMLYNDRCIMCSRCVRFTREVSGTGELYVHGRGSTEQIDVFPGKPLDNKLSLNMVDICPVGALLEKEFLFKQRVWLLKSTPSISPSDSGGENTYLEHNEGIIHRIKPRYNADVNTWWISDDSRHNYTAVQDSSRLISPMRTQYNQQVATGWDKALEQAAGSLKAIAAEKGPGSLFAMLSPMMACEEAWLLGRLIRSYDPQAMLILGPVPVVGEDQFFRNPATGRQTFIIKAEKVPNAAGIRRVMQMLGGPTATYEEAVAATRPEFKKLMGGWIVGGYLSNWLPKDQPAIFKKAPRIVQDILPTALSASADVLLPAAAWAEKDGCWENHQGRVQAFAAAVPPPGGAMREGDVYLRLLGKSGLYNAAAIRKEMGEPFASVSLPAEETETPVFQFQEL